MLLLTILTSLIALSNATCNHDNCLNAFIHTSSLAKPLCATYTQAPHTATSSLPAYATACKNLPSRISCACSCLATASTTLSSSTSSSHPSSTSSSPTKSPTCSPVALKDPTFAQTQAGGDEWVVTINQASGQSVLPIWDFPGTGLFSAEFPNFQSDPFLSTITLSQSSYHVCDGPYKVSYTYSTMINAIAANPVPEISNCTITSGITNIPSSLHTVDLPWETANQRHILGAQDSELQETCLWNSAPQSSLGFTMLTSGNSPSSIAVSYSFQASGLPVLGSDEEVYFIFACELADWWPRTYFSGPSVKFG